MRPSEKDYVILATAKRPVLAQIAEVSGSDLRGKLVETEKQDPKPVTFSRKDILANLGKRPKPGTVFGIKVEILQKTIPHDRFGEIRIYRELDQKQTSAILSGIDVFCKKAKKFGCLGLSTHVEVRNPHGKYLGYYKYNPKATQDILALRLPKTYSPDEFLYIMSHEYGHGVYHRMSNARTRSKWIRLYHSYVVLSSVKKEELRALLSDIKEAGSLRRFTKSSDENANLVLKYCLKYISSVHNLSKHHIETMLTVSEDIEEFWPTSALAVSDKTLVITDYARKSVEELFAESFAYFFNGRMLPKKIDKTMRSTLSRLIKE